MRNRTVLVPFEGLTKAMESYLKDSGYIKQGEEIIYVDFNFYVDDDDNIPVQVGLLELIEDKSNG